MFEGNFDCSIVTLLASCAWERKWSNILLHTKFWVLNYNDRSMYTSIKVWWYDTCSWLLTGCYSFAGKHLQNNLAKKIGKAHAMPVVQVAMPLQKVVAS